MESSYQLVTPYDYHFIRIDCFICRGFKIVHRKHQIHNYRYRYSKINFAQRNKHFTVFENYFDLKMHIQAFTFLYYRYWELFACFKVFYMEKLNIGIILAKVILRKLSVHTNLWNLFFLATSMLFLWMNTMLKLKVNYYSKLEQFFWAV